MAGGDAPRCDLPERSQHRAFERRVERRPVLEIHGAAEVLAQPSNEAPPAPVAQRLVPGLEMVDAVGQEHRKRARDHEMVEGAARVLDDPVPFGLVDHLAAALGENPRRPRVEHEHPESPKSR